MKCIVCDRCKKIIETPRNCRVITCAKPLKMPTENCKVPYRGNDRQQNDIIWEKEICSDCMDALEEFFEQTVDPVTPEPEQPEQPEQPDNPGDGGETPDNPDGGENEGGEQGG